MTVIPWSPDTRRLEILGDHKDVFNWMNGVGSSRVMSMLFPCVVWSTNLCGGTWRVHFGRELTRLIGVGISSVSRTKRRIRMHANCLMDNDDSGPGKRVVSTKNRT